MCQDKSEGGHYKAIRLPVSSFYQAEGVWLAPICSYATSGTLGRS
jgi:hypothetical protein